ncbi:class I SAM-dependent methyltransferase [Neobacillus sp. LXY-1]|uniref:class I SAM-dependent methyltransferase n=1 Tax=Neobacillus sp. LXY-1 TaxID=3379133 RepID=UPI003EE32E72
MDSGSRTKDMWDANLYDGNHSFVSQYGTGLIELLSPKKGEKILDLGCGTGDLAKNLAGLGADVVGVDKSENMVFQAQNKYPELSFVVQDVTQLSFQEDFDAVFSNATLHWVKQPEKALKSIFTCLKKGGRFVAEFGGKGNVQLITDEIIHQLGKAGFLFDRDAFPWYYPSIGEYSNLMEKIGFRVTFAQHFDRPTQLVGDDGLKNWIHMFASDFFEGVSEDVRDSIISSVENELKDTLYKNGHWYADYKRIRVIGIK